MSYRIRRIDPYWLRHPAVLGAAVAAAAAAGFGARAGSTPALALGAAACGAAIFLSVKPALSATFAAFGLLGGLVTFIAGPSAGLSPLMRVLATAGFSVFYMLILDVVVLLVCAIYNGFSRAGLSGLSLRLEGSPADVTVS